MLEDIYQPHNASAVLRSCECFGVQDVHVVEGRNRFEVNGDVALGAGGPATASAVLSDCLALHGKVNS